MIKVYTPNLPKRQDRLQHIKQQYADKPIFDLEIVTPLDGETPAMSLWNTFADCVKKEKEKNSDYFIFCEDDHRFTNKYSEEKLLKLIDVCNKAGVELLTGGSLGVCGVSRITKSLYNVKQFAGTQFIVVFKNAYDTILESKGGVLDSKLSAILKTKMLIYPFISYLITTTSDITWDVVVDMEDKFLNCENSIKLIDDVYYKFYNIFKNN